MMEISYIIGYIIFFFALFLIMIFKPTFIRSFFWDLSKFFKGWQPIEEHAYQRVILVGIRIVGVIFLLVFINGLLVDMGLTKREILADAVTKIKVENLLVPVGIPVGVLGILMGLFGIVAPSKFRSFIWSINEKLYGSLPDENHFFQHVFFYWLDALVAFICSILLLGGILKHYVTF